MAQNNNINNFLQKESPEGDMNAVKQSPQNTSNINLDYIANNQLQKTPQYTTRLEEEANKTKERAFQEVLTGVPNIESPSLTISTQQPNLSKPEVTNAFTTRDEIMSRLNLMDEKGNYTDTYTNYVNQGGGPLPGYEYAHEEMLKQEGIDHLFQQVDSGTMDYDQALMEAYGKDILESMGYNVNSVAWWTNKFLNQDYTTPFSNRYIMDQVKQRAQEYHEARMAGEYGHKKAKDTQLATLVGTEVDTLGSQEIRDLFPMDDIDAEFEDDTKFWNAIHNGQIAAQMRMTQDANGTWYYLHTDGKLYVLDGQQGEGHGTLKMNGDEFEGIDLNNSGAISFGRSAVSGFSKVFTGIGDLVAISAQALSLYWIWGGEEGSDRIFSWANSFDAWLNDDLDALVGTGYVDLNEKISAQDIWNFGGQMAGTIAGTMLLGGIMGSVGTPGSAVGAAKQGTGLIGYGDYLISQGHTIAGTALKGTGTVLKWQTGNIGTQTGATTAAQIWGRRFGAAGVANFKNFLNDYRSMSAQAVLYKDSATEEEIMKRAGVTFLLNTIIDTAISGGMDDNQVQAYKRLTGNDHPDFLMNTEAYHNAMNSLKSGFVKTTNKELLDDAEKLVTNKALKQLIFARSKTIATNSIMDFVGNVATGAISATNQLDKGKMVDFTPLKNINAQTVARSAVNTLWYSTRSQIKDWNTALETIGQTGEDFLSHIDSQLQKNKNKPEEYQALLTYKQKVVESMNSKEMQGKSYEARILNMLNTACKLGENGEVPEALQKIVDKNANKAALDYYQKLYEDGETIYMAKQAKISHLFDPQKTEEKQKFFPMLSKPFEWAKKAGDWASGNSAARKKLVGKEFDDARKIQNIINTIAVWEGDYAKQLFDITDPIIKKAIPESEKNTLISKTGIELYKDNPELKDIIKKHGADASYFMLPQEGKRTKTYNIVDAFLNVTKDLGYIEEVDKSKGLYKIQPYASQLDAVNTAGITDVIYRTVASLSVEGLDLETKTSIINDFEKVLCDQKQSGVAKAGIIARVLNALTETSTTHGNDKSPLLSTDEAANILRNYLQDEKITKIDFSNSKDKEASDAFELLYKLGDTLLKLQSNKEDQINLTDKTVLKGLEQMHNEGTISDEVWKQITKLKDDDFFQSGDHLKSKQQYVENRILKSLAEMVPAQYKGKLSEDDVRYLVSLYFDEQGVNKDTLEKSPLYNDIIRICKEYDDITSSTNTVKINEDNRIFIDLTRFNGKVTSDFTERVIREQLADTKYLNDIDAFKEYGSGVSKETKNLETYKRNLGSVVSFDLNNNTDRQQLKQFLNDMNYDVDITSIDSIQKDLSQIDAVKNFRGDSIVLKINRPAKADDLREQFINTGRIIVGDTELNIHKFVIKNSEGMAEINPIDIERAILDQIELRNIDPTVAKGIKLRQAPLLQLVPFIQSKDGKYNFTTPMTSALMGYSAEESPTKVAGKSSKTQGTQKEHIQVGSAGALLDIDEDLSTFFTLDLIARRLLDDPQHTNIPLSDSEAQKFKAAGIVNYRDGRGKHEDPNNFWTLEMRKSNPVLIFNIDGKAKDTGATLKKMQQYIVSEDFNVYRLLPIMFKESTLKNQGITDIVQNYTTEGYESLPPGMARETGLDILNLKLPWDTEDNRLYAAFIRKLIPHNKELKFNPLEGTKYSVPEDKEYENFDEWYEATSESTNPYDIIARRYIDTFGDMISGEEGQEEYNNESLLIFCRNSRKALLKAIQEDAPINQDLVEQIKQSIPIYDVTAPTVYKYKPTSGITSAGAMRGGSGIEAEQLPVSGKSLGSIFNDDNIVFENPDFVDLETVQKAIDLIKDVQTNEFNDYKQTFYRDYMTIDFVEDNATKILKGLTGNDYYVPIEDADEFSDLVFEDWRKAVDTGTDYTVREDVIPLLKSLYGENYKKDFTDHLFEAAKKQYRLKNDTNLVLQKHFVSYASPSVTNGIYSEFGEAPEEMSDGTIRLPDDANVSGFVKRLRNSVNNKINNNKNIYSKLMDDTSTLIDTELTDALDKHLKEIRNLYTDAPYNSETQNLVERHNSIGLMQTTLNTFNVLKENFKGDDKSLMKLASIITSLNVGVDYAGDTVRYIVANEDGSLVDDGEDLMEKYASANLNELFFNINKAKEDLMHKTIIHTNNQDISNTAAIQMSYKTINSEEDLVEFQQELFHHFMLANNYYLVNQARDEKSRQTLINQMITGQLPEEKAQALLQLIPSDSYSNLQKTKNMYDKFKESTGITKLSRAEFNGTFHSQSAVDVRTLTEEAIEKMLEDPYGSYKRNDMSLAQVMNLAKGLGNPDYYSSEKIKAYHDLQTDLLKTKIEAPEGKELTQDEQVYNFIIDEICSNDDVHTIDLLTRDRSLLKMKEELTSGNTKNAILLSNNGVKKEYMDSKDFKELLESFEPGKTTKPPVDVFITYDTETTLTSNKVINLGLLIHRFENGKWNTEKQNLYVDYDGNIIDVKEKKELRQKLLDDEVYDDSQLDWKAKRFRDNQEAYQTTLKEFLNASGENFKTPEEIKMFFNDLVSKHKVIFAGFNSTNADIPWMLKSGLLSEDILNKMKTIDVRTMSIGSQDMHTKNKAEQEQLSREFGIVNKAAHGGLNDAEVTFELFKKIGALQYNIAAIRDYKYKDLQDQLIDKGLLKDFDDDKLNKVLKTVDEKIASIRDKSKTISDYFDRDIEINPDNVSAATTVFEYLLNRRMVDLSLAIKIKYDEMTYLSEEAINSLSKNKQIEISKIFTVATDKGIDPWDVAQAFKKVLNTFGTTDMNTLLEVLDSETAMQTIKNKLGIAQEEIDAIEVPKKFFYEDLKSDKRFKAHWNDIDNYDKLYGTRLLYDHIKQIIQAVGVEDSSEGENLAKELAKFFSIRKGADVNELFKDEIPYLDTKYQKLYSEYMEHNYGDEDAVIHYARRGLYDLVDAMTIGDRVYDGLTDDYVNIDSSMVVVSKEQFRNLTGMSYDKYITEHPEIIEDGLYTQLLIHPADANYKILPRRIVVDTKLEGASMRVPETILEVLGSRDLDGDHLILFTPDLQTNKALKIYADNIYSVHDVQESMLNYLRHIGTDYDNYKEDNFILNVLGRDKSILDLCYEADKMLSKGEKITEDSDITKRFKETVEAIAKQYDHQMSDSLYNKIAKSLWVKTINLYEVNRNNEPVQFVMNRAIDLGRSKEELTYSGRTRLNAEAAQLISKDYSYAFIDQSTGVDEKQAIYLFKNKEIKNPWTDLLASGIYGSSIVGKYFDNFDGDVDELVSKFREEVNKIPAAGLIPQDDLESSFKDFENELKAGNNAKAFNIYDGILRNLDATTRQNLSSKQFMDILTSEDMLSRYEELNNRIERTKHNIELRNELAKSRKFWGYDSEPTDVIQRTLKQQINRMITDGQAEYNKNLYKDNTAKGTAFVITHFGTPTEEERIKGTVEDTEIKTKYQKDLEALEYYKEKLERKLKLLTTGESQNPNTPDVTYDLKKGKSLKDSIENTIQDTREKIQNIEEVINTFPYKSKNKYRKTFKENENYLPLAWTDKAPDISEDTILYNKNSTKHLVGYSRKVYRLPVGSEHDPKIEEGQVYKRGTTINLGKEKIKLDQDSYIAAKTNNTLVVAGISELDSNFKATSNIGGKGVVNGNYSTDEDILFLINKATQKKTVGGSNEPIANALNGDKVKEERLVVFDQYNRPFIVYGHKENASFKDLEDTTSWGKNKDRNVDLLHIVMDVNTLNGILDMGAKYEDGKLYTNPEAYADLGKSIYNIMKDKQFQNAMPVTNLLKVTAILNTLTDEELQDAYKTNIDGAKIREYLKDNTLMASDFMTSQIYTLGEMFKNRLDLTNPILEKLFSDSLYNILGVHKPTASAEDLDIDKLTSKSHISEKANLDEENNDKRKFSRTKRIHKDVDKQNISKGYKNLEDNYFSLFRLYGYLFDDKYVIDSSEAGRLMREGLLPYGTFIPDTAGTHNGWRHYDVDYTLEDNVADVLVGPGESAKTSYTTMPAEVIGVKPRKVDLALPSERYRRNTPKDKTYMDPNVLSMIVSTDTDFAGYNATAKVVKLLQALEGVRKGDSLDDKKNQLFTSKQQFKTFDNRLALGVDDKNGNFTINLSKHIPVEGTLKDIKDKTKGSLYNYVWFDAIRKDKEKDEHIDYSKVETKKPEQSKNYKKQLDNIYTSLKNDFYNKNTGEINEDKVSKWMSQQRSTDTPRVLSGGEHRSFETSLWGRQGVRADSELGAAVGTAMKNAYAAATFLEQDGLTKLNNLEKLVNQQMSKEEFERFTNLSAIAVADPMQKQALLKHYNIDASEVANELNKFRDYYPEVAIAYKDYVGELHNTLKQVAEKTGQPLDSCFVALISPYISKDKNLNKAMAFSVLKDMAEFKKYNPIDAQNKQSTNMVFSFFNSSKTIIKALSQLQGAQEIKTTLGKQNLLHNDTLIKDVTDIMLRQLETDNKYYVQETTLNKQIQEVVLNEVFELTGTKVTVPPKKNAFEVYKKAIDLINDKLTPAIAVFNNKYQTDLNGYKDFSTKAELTQDIQMYTEAQNVANLYYARMLLGQAMIEGSKSFANDIGKYIAELAPKGEVLVNDLGQEYKFKGVVKPITSSPFSNLIENAEISYNSYDETRWNQFILEKILSGDLYLMQKDVADHLDQNYYTQKHPGPVLDALSKISKWSASFQMALPTKILNRVISFTGFDYSMGIMYDPKVIKYIGEARRQLMAAYMSKGTQMTDEMKQYMMREGQPVGLTGKDFVTFSEEMNAPKMLEKVLNKLTDPLEFQNHLGRYAIYLAALEGFRNNDPNYGPLYYAKDAIDKLETDEDKAMYVMDYMLGSPGGFPQLAKKTSGIMMYATFPMNFGRTMGAYGMSLAKLFKEGYSQENSKQWMRCAITPSMGLAGITALSLLFTSWICDLFGIDGEEKDKMVKDLDTIDIVGTILGGTPAKSSSSMNPIENLYDMTIEPFTNVNNDTLIKKLFGVVNTNITSHLNPALKYPAEMLSGYDIYGSSLVNTKYSYNAIENGIRKALGFVIGTGTSNALVDQYKIDKYSDDRSFSDTVRLGLTRGISYDLGNQKSYKKDTTNYYNNIYKINNYKYKESNGLYSQDAEDYTLSDSMERIRNYKSKYGSYNVDDYKRISKLLKKAIDKKESPTVVYSIIIDEYNKGVSEVTLKTVLNNNSLARKLDTLQDKEAYLRTLSTAEYGKLVKALEYEERMYPYLKEFFPNKTNLPSVYINPGKTYYKKSGGGSSYPRNYYPKKAPQVYWYPNNGYSNKKISTKKPKASIEKVEVNVSPQMGVWTRDYNKVTDLQHWKDSNYNRVKPLEHGGGK